MGPVVVTGATGKVGGAVARALADAGVRTRLVVRDPSRAPALPGGEVRVAEYGDHDAVRDAFAGAAVVLMVSAAEHEHRLAQHLSVVEAAADAGVRQVVYTSFHGAAADATFTLGRDHAATEDRLRELLPASTYLRDNLYADLLPDIADEHGVLRGPAGDGRLSAVAVADVVDSAVAVLLDPAAHEGRTYDLTGPEELTLEEGAEVLTRVLGRPFRYEPETLEEAYRSRAHYGAPDWQVEAWVSTYTAIAVGEMAGLSEDVERLTGHPARTLEQVLRARP